MMVSEEPQPIKLLYSALMCTFMFRILQTTVEGKGRIGKKKICALIFPLRLYAEHYGKARETNKARARSFARNSDVSAQRRCDDALRLGKLGSELDGEEGRTPITKTTAEAA